MSEEKTKVEDVQSTEESKKGSAEIKLSAQAEEVVKTIAGMTVLELSNLVKVLEDKFGVSASMPVMAGYMPGAAAGASA
ncbi:MAG: hypothetical protein V1662_01380, partial [Candidatus Omnitrophota bacterium]